jgi:UDP-N-acetylmuramoylalanine--D-glutamate ligase
MNFPANLFAGQRFAVVGLGRNGLPSACALAAMGAEVVAWDDRPEARATAGVAISDPCVGEFKFDALILSPGIPHNLPSPHPAALRARAAGVPILADSELLFRAVRAAGSRARFVGITGTNGKSTTTALVAHVLATAGYTVATGGNLGPAALALPLLPDHGVYILEMSSYLLERLATLRFDAAAMLNISADHLDRHGSLEAYAAAKRAVFDRQQPSDLAVIGVDDPLSRAMALSLDDHPARVVTISGATSADIWCDGSSLRDRHGPIMPIPDAPALPGAHNAQNAAAAVAIASHLGVSRAALVRGLGSFTGLAHRQQRLGCVGGVLFVNDSKATNADAAARALSCYDRLIWIAGGISKEGGIEPLTSYFPRIARALLIGRDAPIFAATLARHGVPHTIVRALDAAVPAALAAARETRARVVLLSPAAASFDQFAGFEARGECFAAAVATLHQGCAA